ncbi:MAG: RNA methyltransferase [Chloroflexaceae bacterium]|nr:RNA methyltransferase [Chloroflexaceae bacterium]
MTGTVALERIVIVLNQPQDVVNIGGVVRCMKNMGFRWLRLVSPVSFNADDITRLAHRSEDILSNTRIYSDLNTALSDAVYVVGTTARMRGQHTIRSDIRTVAVNITQQTEQGIVALLFGPEDNGLDRQALDRCHVVLRIPADPTTPRSIWRRPCYCCSTNCECRSFPPAPSVWHRPPCRMPRPSMQPSLKRSFRRGNAPCTPSTFLKTATLQPLCGPSARLSTVRV